MSVTIEVNPAKLFALRKDTADDLARGIAYWCCKARVYPIRGVKKLTFLGLFKFFRKAVEKDRIIDINLPSYKMELYRTAKLYHCRLIAA